MIDPNHVLRNEQAEAFAAHVEVHPDLVSAISPSNNERADDQRQARAARQTASLLRHAKDPTYLDWVATDPIGNASEALINNEALEPATEPLPSTILGVEKDLDHCRNERLGLLWKSGQDNGLGKTGGALLDALAGRSKRLSDQKADLFNRLRLDFSDLPAAEAIRATKTKAEQKGRLTMLQAHAAMERDGIIHLPSTDAKAEKFMPLIGAGKHILLMGPRGNVKSRFFEYLAQKSMDFAGKEGLPYKVGLNPNTLQSELIGRWTLKDGDTIFEPGPIMKAFIEDKPVIINEFNNADHELVSALEDIMLLSEGKSITFQQGDVKQSYARGKNFCVLGTANPDGKLHDRFAIDAAMRERFTGGIYDMEYPDSDVGIGEDPTENLYLLEVLLTDKSGMVAEPNTNWSASDVDTLAKIAHWTQYLASNPASSVDEQRFKDLFDNTNYGTLQPVLSNVVLGPRAMLELASRAQADPRLSLADVLVDFADAPDMRTHSAERRIFANILHELRILEAGDIEKRLHLPGYKTQPQTTSGA